MHKKILISLIIFGIIFLGSATYALFNENFLLNDVVSNVQTNDTSLSNNQLNIQNNPANVVLNDIGVVKDGVGQNVVKEVYRVTAGNRTEIVYDDSTTTIIRGNNTSHLSTVLTYVYDTTTIDGGYVECADCGNFIPVGKVSGLVSEKFLCQCPDEHNYPSVDGFPFVFSEESVVQHTWLNENSATIPDNTYIGSAYTTDINNISIPDKENQLNTENTN